jgi:hypothetical protein
MPKEVTLVPVLVDIDNLDFGDLCPKFELKGADRLELAAPRKASNITLAQESVSETPMS